VTIVPLEVSIIVPVFNEEENIHPLAREIVLAMEKEPRAFEMVFVDDASTDRTWDKILQFRREDQRMRGVRHGQNAGQSAALWTGLQVTASPILATLDGDLQNDPADLPILLSELVECDFIAVSERNGRTHLFVEPPLALPERPAIGSWVDSRMPVVGCVSSNAARLTGVPFDGCIAFCPSWSTALVQLRVESLFDTVLSGGHFQSASGTGWEEA
jgi:glycosyltransferase involved in cell wall biosynthesis